VVDDVAEAGGVEVLEVAAELELGAAGPQAQAVAGEVGEGGEQGLGHGLEATDVAADLVAAGGHVELDVGAVAAGDADGELDGRAALAVAGAQGPSLRDTVPS